MAGKLTLSKIKRLLTNIVYRADRFSSRYFWWLLAFVTVASALSKVAFFAVIAFVALFAFASIVSVPILLSGKR